ncbi:MAG TPA: nickel pincer cofactor biosynthesis protein LarC [Anaeromyxobacteraceae bacterium]|nr:nickel pincer cofactor biosynthesis protein LarC [Anaeromyxobacteraceae bacterium]
MSTPLLLLEPIGGVAGDMFLAAALDAGVDRAALEAHLATLGLPGWRLEVTRRSVSGIQATHVDVVVEGEQPPSRRLADILDLVGRSGLPPRARAAAIAVFERIGRAEAKVHGVPVEEVHFHEVGAVDSIVDVCGAAVVLDLLGWPRVLSAPPELGRGLVKTAHGPMPVPPPAVLELLAGKPVRPGGPPGEAVTPTGAALLAHFAELGPLPPFVARSIGYGAGTVTWPDRPNVLRLVLADTLAPSDGANALFVVETNLDDCPGQLVARAVEALLEAGALDAWAAPLTMKKGRPGVLVGALCDGARRAAVARVLLTETTTLGVRFHPVEREELSRALHEVETPYGRVRVKVGALEGREVGAHPEYEDCRARAAEHGVPVREVMAAALAAWRSGRR